MLTHPLQSRFPTSPQILSYRYRFEMCGIYTGAVPTEMIQPKTVGNLPYVVLIIGSVSVDVG